MWQSLRGFALGLTLLLATAGYAAQAGSAPGVEAAATAGQAPSAEAAAQADPVGADYVLGAADKVRVIVFGEQALTGEFLVGASGKISLPLIGEVQAAGLTIPQFQNEIADSLRRGYIKEPKVSAEVLNYRPFYILGEVQKPGEYPYTNNLNVLNAVATAGGFTYRANKKEVYIRRGASTVEQKYPLTITTKVAPGDTIRIGERYF